MPPELRTPVEPPETVDKRLTDWLSDHASEAGHAFDNRTFQVELVEDGAVRAGLSGYRLFDWLFVRYLAVAPDRRGQGFGAAVLREAERRAKAEGILGVFIDTYGFQACDFYTRLGYRVFGTLPHPVPARSRHYLMKEL